MSSLPRIRFLAASGALGGLCLLLGVLAAPALGDQGFLNQSSDKVHPNDELIRNNTRRMMDEGRQTFRFDTFGSEKFFGDTLQLHKAIEGAKLGGVDAGVSPKAALGVGLKVDVDAVPQATLAALKAGQVNLDDPAVTLALLKLNAVVGLTGEFNPNGSLKSLGAQCALCHATVDDSFAPGIGHRLDGWANQDLNIGAILALSPDLSVPARLLNVDQETLKAVLNQWGPGKFDAEVFMDGKALNPATGKPAPTLIPPAFGLAGVNNHTWTGSWGNVTYWNAFVANLEMHGSPGTFFDPRLDNAKKFPIAAANGFGNVRPAPGQQDRISPKLPALEFYQLAIPAPKAPEGTFDKEAAASGKTVFEGAGKCATCHVPPTFTEPGYNLHPASDIGIDDFQASRSPDDKYRTTPLAGRLFWRTRGYYHDGRFATLLDVVKHYNSAMNLGLNTGQMSDLVEYLKSI